MPLNEAETRAKLIDPALRGRGWTEDLIHREVTAGAILIGAKGPRKSRRGRADYVLRVKVRPESQAIALALIEAKAEDLPPMHGLEQGKLYAFSKRLNVQVVFSCNGHQYVEYDRMTGKTDGPWPVANFPTPDDLRARYERAMRFSLDSEAARPLLQRYPRGETQRRYYQDAAIRAVLEKLARGDKRALLELATGSGKTFIAVQLLRKIADAGQLRRALFVCDRDELRTQGLGAFHDVFGTDAAPVSTASFPANARIHVATYQTLGVDTDEADATFLLKHYPEDYFSHIVIDECHRSAWGKWSAVLLRNPGAIQVGLTATPRQLEIRGVRREADVERLLVADNLRHFGEPVYEYDIAQGIEDGYLAACEIVRRDVFLDDKKESERVTGLTRDDLVSKVVSDARTGEALTPAGRARAEPYAFKCTAAVQGADMIADFKAASRRFFVATTVELLTTGVDVPPVRNIVFFKYVRSSIAFYQMLGRGTRLHPPTGKLMFRVYDYTDATRLFGEAFITRLSAGKDDEGPGPGPAGEPVLRVEGIEVRISPAGRYIVTRCR